MKTKFNLNRMPLFILIALFASLSIQHSLAESYADILKSAERLDRIIQEEKAERDRIDRIYKENREKEARAAEEAANPDSSLGGFLFACLKNIFIIFLCAFFLWICYFIAMTAFEW